MMMALLDAEGLTSVVATNCEQHYGRPLVIGDRVLVRSVIEAISDPKRTALGYRPLRHDPARLHRRARRRGAGPTRRAAEVGALAESGGAGGHHALPHPQVPAAAEAAAAGGGRRVPGPASPRTTPSGSREPRRHQLLIQRCTSCGTLRHPPLPACAVCRSLEWDTVRGQRPRHPLLLRGGPLPPGARRSSTRCPSDWSSWRRAPGSWPTSTASTRPTSRSAWRCRPQFVDFDDELSLPVFVAGRRRGGGD